jgi:hypothetical protein
MSDYYDKANVAIDAWKRLADHSLSFDIVGPYRTKIASDLREVVFDVPHLLNRITALEAENERLREALSAFLQGADEGYVSVEVDRTAREALTGKAEQ